MGLNDYVAQIKAVQDLCTAAGVRGSKYFTLVGRLVLANDVRAQKKVAYSLASIGFRGRVPVIQLFESVGEAMLDPKLREGFNAIARGIYDGETISHIMEQYPNLFASREIELIRKSQSSGTLDNAFSRLAI